MHVMAEKNVPMNEMRLYRDVSPCLAQGLSLNLSPGLQMTVAASDCSARLYYHITASTTRARVLYWYCHLL